MDNTSLTYIITGGCSGLGLATVTHLLSKSMKVAAFDLNINNPAIESLKAQYSGSFQLLVLKVDVTKQDELTTAFNKVCDTLGPISGIVNCAGVLSAGLIKHRKPKYTMNETTFSRTLKINVIGTFLMCQTYVNLSIQKGYKKGVIVNISSVAAQEGQQGQVAYSASKGAIMSMTMPMARELGKKGIRVVCVMPGLFNTSMAHAMPPKVEKAIFKNSALGRYGKPEEFADFIESMLKNDYLTGVNLRLDGGTRLPML